MSCHLPEDLYYWIDKHIWARPEADGTVVLGMTDVAQSMAGKIVVVNLRSLGKTLAKGKSAGTLESGKWVGSIPTPVAGKVIAVNEQLKKQADLVNQDPYGEGWLIRMEPTDWETDRQTMAQGANGVAEYRKKLEADGVDCGR